MIRYLHLIPRVVTQFPRAQFRSHSTTSQLQREARQLYKELLFLGRDYPLGEEWFRQKLHNCFIKKSGVTDVVELQKALDHGKFIQKEILALYSLKKYRHLNKVYSNTQELDDLKEMESKWTRQAT
jgi:hypothetical protein